MIGRGYGKKPLKNKKSTPSFKWPLWEGQDLLCCKYSLVGLFILCSPKLAGFTDEKRSVLESVQNVF